MKKAMPALLLSATCALSACSTEPELSDAPPSETSAAASSAASGDAAEHDAAPEDVRARAAAKLMPPALNYEDARAKLEAGVGGLFIPSWADPELLSDGPRGVNALREELGRDFEVSIDFEGGRVQRFSEILGDYPSPQAMAEGHSPEEVEALAMEIGQSLSLIHI